MIDLDTRKWGGLPHWRFPTTLLGRDGHGTWLALPAGTPYTGPRGEGSIEHGMVTLVPEGAWWVASFHEPSSPETAVYVDVAMPATWPSPSHVTMVDLDLDVIKRADGTVLLDDEDEFDEHRVRYGYGDEVVETARATARWLMDAVAGGVEPFGTASARWVEMVPGVEPWGRALDDHGHGPAAEAVPPPTT